MSPAPQNLAAQPAPDLERRFAGPQFVRVGNGFAPLPAARGGWASGTLAGPAVAGLLAHVMDTERGDPSPGASGDRESALIGSRIKVDLFRMVRDEPLEVRTRTVRAGRRILVVEAELMQDGRSAVRATATFYRRSTNPPGRVWSEPRQPVPPPADIEPRRIRAASGDGPYFELPADGPGWQNAERKRVWAMGWQVVADERTTPFARAAMLSDTTNLVTGMGTGGVECINGDVTMALSRLPIGDEIGLESDHHLIHDGVYAAASTMFDRDGRFGVCSVTGLISDRALHAPTRPIIADD